MSGSRLASSTAWSDAELAAFRDAAQEPSTVSLQARAPNPLNPIAERDPLDVRHRRLPSRHRGQPRRPRSPSASTGDLLGFRLVKQTVNFDLPSDLSPLLRRRDRHARHDPDLLRVARRRARCLGPRRRPPHRPLRRRRGAAAQVEAPPDRRRRPRLRSATTAATSPASTSAIPTARSSRSRPKARASPSTSRPTRSASSCTLPPPPSCPAERDEAAIRALTHPEPVPDDRRRRWRSPASTTSPASPTTSARPVSSTSGPSG